MKNYHRLETLILRTPTNSLSQLEKLQDLSLLMKDKSFLEALYISSPALYNDIKRYDEITDKKKLKKITESIYKFYCRMCTRPTPYGLFATCGTLKIDNETNINLEEPKLFIKNIRLDMNFLCALSQSLEKDTEIRKSLKFFPNSSIYSLQESYRYIEYKYKDSSRNHFLSAVPKNEYLEKIFKLAASNGASIDELTNCIIDNEISREDAHEFIVELILNQLLISELEPTVLTGDFLVNIIEIISKIPVANEICETLIDIQQTINDINKTQIGINTEIYETLIKKIETLDIGIDRGKLFQLDYSNTTIQNAFNQNILNDIEKCMEFLNYFNTIKFNSLETFIEKFSERHEEAEIPLTIALDNETGVYSASENTEDTTSPLVDDIPVFRNNSGTMEFRWTKKDNYLNHLIQRAIFEDETIIKLDEKDVAKYFKKNENIDTVPSFAVMFSLIKENEQIKIELENAGGNNSAIDLQGRFAHINKDIFENIQLIAKAEEADEPDKIFADIVHLPESRVGNILMRPALHTHQIPYLAKATCKNENAIDINDLMVSVKDGQVILRSKRLNKIIIPRLSNAHNYSMSTLNIYSFLCKLQTHNKKSYFGFDLGNCGNIFTYIPRIEFKNIILSLATWNLSKKHFIEIIESNSKNNFEEAVSLFSDFRKKYKIPTKVLLADGDNLLYFNFDDQLSLKVYLDEIKNRDSFTLKEFIMNESSDIVKSGSGNYCHQIIASYIKEKKPNNLEQIATQINEDIPERQFVVGSDWLYYKIYCGAKIADNFLSEELKSITESLQASYLIKKWFFIRYSDNQGLHLRIRFEIANEEAITKISNQLFNATKKYIDDGLIHKIQLDTYDREIERYGKSTMALSETFFFLDSQNILNFIDLIEGDEGELYRWLFALKNTDAIFDSFNMALDEKIKFTAKNAAGFLTEFGGSKFTKEEINKKYRDNKELILGFMENSNEVEDWQIIFDEINNAKNLRIDLCTKIKEEVEKNKEVPFDYILSSYIHMSINRLFRSKQRKNEMVIYDFLNKYYLWKANTQKN